MWIIFGRNKNNIRENKTKTTTDNQKANNIKNLTNLAAGVGVVGVVGINNSNHPQSPLRNSGLPSDSSFQTNHQLPPAACSINTATTVKLRKFSDRQLTNPSEAKSHTYRISMANLEQTQESELDVILGELSLLEAQIDLSMQYPNTNQNNLANNGLTGVGGVGEVVGGHTAPSTRTHSRTNSTTSGATSISLSTASETQSNSSSGISENGLSSSSTISVTSSSHGREPRTESPDNDSAFSDTVSLLSSESSASSSLSSNVLQKQIHHQQMQYMHHHQLQQQQQYSQMNNGSSKAAKIQLALHKLESASIRRLFVKAYTSDGASKSLLVDERMTCGHVTRMVADKNHVPMQANWSLVESLGDLQMERLFEDHEMLVDNLMTWNSDAGNKVLFQQRSDKVALFLKPEIFLPGPQMAPGCLHDEHTRSILLEEFFETNSEIQVDGPLYMKADSKKGWKRYHFVLKSSGLYYFPKEKTKNARDLACLTLFNGYNVYKGIGWKKKWKAPTDYTFGFKSAVDSSLGKTCRTLKMLCAEDLETMEKWITAIRIAKYGKQLWENHKTLIEDLTMCDGLSNSSFAVSMRSESISSISSAVPSQCGSVSSAISSMSNSSSGRISRASSSSSSGCLSDDNNAFDSEFTTGTIKRKPSMKPNLPLTSMTRQLKEVGENVGTSGGDSSGPDANSPERSGTLTRRHSRRKSQESNGSGTLKRRPQNPANLITTRGSVESMNNINSSGSSNSTPTPTPSGCNKPPLLDYEQSLSKQPSSSGIYGTATNPSVAAVVANDLMSSSTLSLDSLPPPPPPQVLENDPEIYGSQLSLASLPPPPPPEDVTDNHQYNHNHNHIQQQMQQQQQQANHLIYQTNGVVIPPAVPAKPVKTSVLKSAPPYKDPPSYNGGSLLQNSQASNPPPPPPSQTTTTQKKVSFADSPVLLRRKMCSPEPRSPSTPTQNSPSQFYNITSGMMPPGGRVDYSRLSQNSSSTNSSSSPGNCLSMPPPSQYNHQQNYHHFYQMNQPQPDFGSPKRLQESSSNPPRDFLKDLQRVMRKKWQVAQKCKLEPATTPHEVLGFRDFSSEDLLAHNLNNASNNSHYYRETANVSNWVQEHYGSGVQPLVMPINNEYALYENVHTTANGLMNEASGLMMEPQFPHSPQVVQAQAAAAAAMAQRKKRPPPPPPKRSDSTHLTHRA